MERFKNVGLKLCLFWSVLILMTAGAVVAQEPGSNVAGTDGVGVFMRGKVWVDANQDGTSDLNSEAAAGLWVDVFDEASGAWGGAPVGADGTYEINLPVEAGEFQVTVWPEPGILATNAAGGVFALYENDDVADGFDGYATGDWEMMFPVPVNGADVVVNIELPKGAVINGVVTDEDGRPVQWTRIHAWSDATHNGGGAETNESGEFTIFVPPGPNYDLYVEPLALPSSIPTVGGFFKDADGGEGDDPGPDQIWMGKIINEWEARTLIEVPSEGVSGVHIYVDSGVKVYGKVVSADGNPIPNLWVEAHSERIHGWGGGPTDELGDFEFVVPPGEGYIISVWPGEMDFVGGYWKEADDTTTPEREGVIVLNPDKATIVDIMDDLHLKINVVAGPSISGRVTTADGTPVPRVWVEAGSDSTGFWNGDLTNAEGYYRIPVSAAADFRVILWGDGKYQTVFYDNALSWEAATLVNTTNGPVTDIDLVLSKGETIAGTVDGLPAGKFAWIEVWSDATGSWGATEIIGEVDPIHFEISGLQEADDFVLAVWSRHFQNGFLQPDGSLGQLESALRISSGTKDILIRMNAGKSISGTITGLAVGDHLYIEAISPCLGGGCWGGTEIFAENDAAEFTISGLADRDDFYIHVWSENYINGFYGGAPGDAPSEPVTKSEATRVGTTAGNVEGVNILVSSGYSISGAVTGLGEGEIAWIEAASEETGDIRGTDVIGTGEAVPYIINGLKPAPDFRVAIWTKHYVSGFYSENGLTDYDNADLIDASTNPGDIDFKLDAGHIIGGVITGLPKNEIAHVEAWSESVRNWGSVRIVGTGEPIAYEISGLLAANDFSVHFLPNNFAHAVQEGVDSSLDPMDIDFTVSEGFSISGKISCLEPNSTVWIDAWSQSSLNSGFAEARTDENGTAAYEIKGLGEASDYIVAAWTRNRPLFYDQQLTFDSATPVDLTSGSRTDIDFDFCDIELFRLSGVIEGLTDDHPVMIEVWDGNSGVWGHDEGFGNITFEIELPPGNYKLGVFAEGFADAFYTESGLTNQIVDAATIPFTEDKHIGILTLETPGYTVSGLVTDAEGNTLKDIWVEIANSEGKFYGDSTNARGIYKITGVSNGDYHLLVVSTKGVYETVISVNDANVVHDITLGGGGFGKLSGTVNENGAPLAGAVVILFENYDVPVIGDFEQGLFNATPTDDQGYYEFGGIPPGEYTIAVDVEDDGVLEYEQTLIITAGANEHDVELAVQ